MAQWDDDLSPMMKERLARIGEISAEDKERMKSLEQLNSLLADFYADRLDSDALWVQLKEHRDAGRAYLLREAQTALTDSLGTGATGEDIQKRKEGILAIESLKEEQNTSVLEMGFDSIWSLQKSHKEELDETYESVKGQVEANPQLRMQQVRQGQSVMVTQLSVDEAVRNIPEWKSFVAQHEARYVQEFTRLVADLKSHIK
jgi:hypothetical protein